MELGPNLLRRSPELWSIPSATLTEIGPQSVEMPQSGRVGPIRPKFGHHTHVSRKSSRPDRLAIQRTTHHTPVLHPQQVSWVRLGEQLLGEPHEEGRTNVLTLRARARLSGRAMDCGRRCASTRWRTSRLVAKRIKSSTGELAAADLGWKPPEAASPPATAATPHPAANARRSVISAIAPKSKSDATWHFRAPIYSTRVADSTSLGSLPTAIHRRIVNKYSNYVVVSRSPVSPWGDLDDICADASPWGGVPLPALRGFR